MLLVTVAFAYLGNDDDAVPSAGFVFNAMEVFVLGAMVLVLVGM